jgi:hypothetical protein
VPGKIGRKFNITKYIIGEKLNAKAVSKIPTPQDKMHMFITREDIA